MALYTRFTMTVTVETPADRQPQLLECLNRFNQDLEIHEFRSRTSTMETGPRAVVPAPVSRVQTTTPRKKK